ncbi:MAG TPA: hypothetical protein DGL25_04585 [Dehalococcoidia bacterium]|nr:hypothetical protein [Dehalococcoidia bacterium]
MLLVVMSSSLGWCKPRCGPRRSTH